MKVFIAGITGATGRLLAEQLLTQGHSVVALARESKSLPSEIVEHPALQLEIGSLLDISDSHLSELVSSCDAIGCCLGHNMSRQGIWGHPRLLVRDAISRLHRIAIEQSDANKIIKLVLMSSNGVKHPNGSEHISLADRSVISLLRHIIPPHNDNEQAAEFLIKQSESNVQWCIVRPDNLKDAEIVSDYKAFGTAKLGVIFGAGFVSRINVAAFMNLLITDQNAWSQWQGKMPVIYNAESV